MCLATGRLTSGLPIDSTVMPQEKGPPVGPDGPTLGVPIAWRMGARSGNGDGDHYPLNRVGA